MNGIKLDTIQDLFERWINVEQSNIWEYSTDISSDLEEVKLAAKEFAQKHNLVYKDEWFK